MKDILREILANKRREVKESKSRVSLAQLKQNLTTMRPLKDRESFFSALNQSPNLSIIAEMKKQSPSGGLLQKDYRPVALAELYAKAGARALSVLTDEKYFGGSLTDLRQVANASSLPILRKDFTVDIYQIYEAKYFGANAVLLIMAALSDRACAQFLRCAEELEMDALVEVHSREELERALNLNPKIVGINNRNLKTLTTRIETTFELLDQIPRGVLVVAESGIQEPGTVESLRLKNVNAALIGESILRNKNIVNKVKSLVDAGRKDPLSLSSRRKPG